MTPRSRDAKYDRTPKGLARRKRQNAERAVSGKNREREAVRTASGAGAEASRRKRDNRKAYELELFAEAPEKRVRVDGASRVVILSDLQIPFEDPEALDQALEVLHRVGPDLVVLDGDVADCYAESAFLKDSVKAEKSIPESHRRVRELMGILRGVRRKVWMGGNHEDRWRRLLWADGPTATRLLKAHEAATGRSVPLLDPVESFRQVFGMDAFGFEYYPYSHRLYLAEGNLVVTHGKYVSRHSGYAAKRSWEWLGASCIVGHTHRLGAHYITQDGHEAGAWENGCLCQLEPEYDDAPNWQQGFSVVRVDGPEFHVIQVPIIRRGKLPVAVYHGEGA